MDVSFNTKLEIAVEILATKIANVSNERNINQSKMQQLLNEREEMYKGNLEVIEKIIREYGPEVKMKYQGV